MEANGKAIFMYSLVYMQCTHGLVNLSDSGKFLTFLISSKLLV